MFNRVYSGKRELPSLRPPSCLARLPSRSVGSGFLLLGSSFSKVSSARMYFPALSCRSCILTAFFLSQGHLERVVCGSTLQSAHSDCLVQFRDFHGLRLESIQIIS